MNYSINKLSPPIMQGVRQSIGARGGGEGVKQERAGGEEEEGARLYCVCHFKRYCSPAQSNEDHF